MKHDAKVIADSISEQGHRLTTFEIVIPRIVLAEFNTHRMISRNSASSRAIPVKKMLKKVMEHPYIPGEWGKNQKGMQAGEDLDKYSEERARQEWLDAADDARGHAQRLLDEGVHKQLTNRLLEPFMWHTVICTATDWSNFFNLRNNKHAHPDIRKTAGLMQELYEGEEPKLVRSGGWHLPYVQDQDWDSCRSWLKRAGTFPEDTVRKGMVRISSARCARVSYLTHDGKRDIEKDLDLYDRLLQPGHMSPFEHPARPMEAWEYARNLRTEALVRSKDTNQLLVLSFVGAEVLDEVLRMNSLDLVHKRSGAYCGNFNGWVQHRKEIPGEEDILGYRKEP